jgi:hypothetical protein
LHQNKTGLRHCIEKGLGHAASALEAGLDFVQAQRNRKRMTLHDKIAGTIVIKILKIK